MSNDDEIARLRARCAFLEAQIRTTPTLYFAALAGIIQGQQNPGADCKERVERARAIEKMLGRLVTTKPVEIPWISGRSGNLADLPVGAKVYLGRSSQSPLFQETKKP